MRVVCENVINLKGPGQNAKDGLLVPAFLPEVICQSPNSMIVLGYLKLGSFEMTGFEGGFGDRAHRM